MGYFLSFLGGALLTLVVVTVGGIGQVDCTEVRDVWAAYTHEIRVNPERVEEAMAYAEDNRQCFSSWEFTGGSADELPPLPGDE